MTFPVLPCCVLTLFKPGLHQIDPVLHSRAMTLSKCSHRGRKLSPCDPSFTSSCHHLASCVALKERGDKVLDASSW